jgi:uncharacterized membrane protein YtjA (UPF0391 family)
MPKEFSVFDGIIIFLVLSLFACATGMGVLAISFVAIAQCLVVIFAALFIVSLIYSEIVDYRRVPPP